MGKRRRHIDKSICPECGAKTKVDYKYDETYCSKCGLILNISDFKVLSEDNLSIYEGKLSENEVFRKCRISYKEYLRRNLFKNNDELKCKYLRRYNQKEFNNYLEDINNIVMVKQFDKKDVCQPKYDYE